jgi:hypothetical protein
MFWYEIQAAFAIDDVNFAFLSSRVFIQAQTALNSNAPQPPHPPNLTYRRIQYFLIHPFSHHQGYTETCNGCAE